jgi:hypothetical protein
MEIVRHNWQVGPDHDAIECAEEPTGHRIGHTCAGCGAHLSLDYLEFTFAGTSDVLADADVVAASMAASRS